ncbi:hypothetical protein Tco_0382157 [Tanacetum coccineum]
MTNLWNDNERFIADNIAKDICSFVLSSEKQVSPDRIDVVKQTSISITIRVQSIPESLHFVVSFNGGGHHQEAGKLKIFNITRMLNVGPTIGSLDQQALETEVTQLKDALTSLQIQNDGYKIENANVNRRYLELSTASTHSRNYTQGIVAILNAENTKLNAEAVGKKNSGPTELVKPKVLASMMYTKSSKYIVPPKRANWVQPTPLPKKKQFVVHSTKSVHVKTHQAKCAVNTSKNAWKATKEDVARIVPQWKPTGKRFNLCDIYGPRMSTEPIVTPSKFTPCVSPRTNVTLSMEPVLKPLELTPCVSSSSSSTVTMVSRFFDYRLGDRKAGSNGISAIFE